MQYSLLHDNLNHLCGTNGRNIMDMRTSASKIWTINAPDILGIYDGANWRYDTTDILLAKELLVQNDSTAFVMNHEKIQRYKNGSISAWSALPVNAQVIDWDIDSRGCIWVCTTTNLLNVATNGFVTFTDTSNSPIGTDEFTTVFTDNTGNVWALGQQNMLYKYDGQNWGTYIIPMHGNYINNAGVDKQTGKVFIINSDSLYTFYNGVFKSYYFGNMPYTNIKAFGPKQILPPTREYFM